MEFEQPLSTGKLGRGDGVTGGSFGKAVAKGGSVKTLALLGLVSLPLVVAYNMEVAGGASEAAQIAGRPGAMPEPALVGRGGTLPASLPDYVFLHQTLHESIPVHTMAGVKACPE